MLDGGEINRIGLARVQNKGVVGEAQPAKGSVEARADVAEAVDVAVQRESRVNLQEVRLAQIVDARGVNVQHGHKGNGSGQVELKVVTQANQHGSLRIISFRE